MNTKKTITVTRSSLFPIVAAAALIFVPDVLPSAHFIFPLPLTPGTGRLFGGAFGDRHPSQPAQPASPDAVRPVFDNYLKIQAALAQDSIQGVPESAAAIAKAVRSDSGRTFSPRLARQADRLGRAKNLADARAAFVRVSPHLIDYVKKNHVAGFYNGYCRMQKAAWLQADPTIANPYMGKAMPRCAWFEELNGAACS